MSLCGLLKMIVFGDETHDQNHGGKHRFSFDPQAHQVGVFVWSKCVVHYTLFFTCWWVSKVVRAACNAALGWWEGVVIGAGTEFGVFGLQRGTAYS